MEIVTLSSRGQVAIPAKNRKQFSLKEGDSLILVEENNGIRLQPLTNLSDLRGADPLKETGLAVRELRKEWDDDLEKKTSH